MSDQRSSFVIVEGGADVASLVIFTARAGFPTVVIDADQGMTRRAWLQNHLGFVEGITGPDLVDGGRAQAERAGATWVDATAEAIEGSACGFTVRATDGQEFAASNVILATGASVTLAEAAGVATRAGTEPYIKSI